VHVIWGVHLSSRNAAGDVTKICMLISPDSEELPGSEERQKIMDRAHQTVKDAQMLLERLDELERHNASHAQIAQATF
jgi:hypothetical protein